MADADLSTNTHEFTCHHDLCQLCFYLGLAFVFLFVFILSLVLIFRRYQRRKRCHIDVAIKNLDNAVRTFQRYIKYRDNFTFQEDIDRCIKTWIEILSSCTITIGDNVTDNNRMIPRSITIGDNVTDTNRMIPRTRTIGDNVTDTNRMMEHNSIQNETVVTIEDIPVQVYRKEGKGINNEFVDELWTHLNCDLATKMKFVERSRSDDIDLNLQTLVLCLTNSRLGSDAVNAIKDITVQSNVALVICHHQEIHALPKTPSAKRLTEARFDGIGGIYDLAFTSDKGIYQCEMNIQAKKDIVKFVLKNA